MSVEVRIFDPPEAESPTFRSAGRATACTSVSTVERHWTPGSFSIEIPTEARHADKLSTGRLVLIDGGFWGIVDDVSRNADSAGDMLTVTGRQLKGLTLDRVTIPPSFTSVTGAQGYDPANGSTETVMKHFVNANLGPGAQAGRAVYGLELAPDLGRGEAEDKYMSRHEVLADVLAALGEASGLGYDIVPDLRRHKFVFDVAEGADHTARQSERKRVVFDLKRKTAQSQSYARHTSDSRNLFYATMAGSKFADETLKQLQVTLESLPEKAQALYRGEQEAASAEVLLSLTDAQRDVVFAKLAAVEAYQEFKSTYPRADKHQAFLRQYNENHPEKPLTKRQLNHWQTLYDRDGVAGLVDRRGGYNKGQSSIPKDVADVFLTYWLQEKGTRRGGPSVASCRRLTPVGADLGTDD